MTEQQRAEEQRIEMPEKQQDVEPRCTGVYTGQICGRLLARVLTRPWRLECPRCHTTNERR